MKYLDVFCAIGITLLVLGHHLVINGFQRFDLHPAVVAIGLFFSIFGAYKMAFGKLLGKD